MLDVKLDIRWLVWNAIKIAHKYTSALLVTGLLVSRNGLEKRGPYLPTEAGKGSGEVCNSDRYGYTLRQMALVLATPEAHKISPWIEYVSCASPH